MTTKDTKKRLKITSFSLFESALKIREDKQLPLIIECCFRFIICLIFASVRFAGGISPFSYSMVSVSGVGIEGIFASLGAIFGYFLFGSSTLYIKYIVSVILCFVCLFTLRPLKISQSKFFRPAIAAVISASTGFVYIESLYTALIFTAETLCVFFSSIAFRLVLSPRRQNSDYTYGISAALLISLFCTGLSGITLLSVLSIGRTLAIIFLLMTAFKAGYGRACPLGVICGLILDLADGKGIFFTVTYSVAAAVSSVFSNKNTLIFTISFIISNFFSAFILRESYFFLPCLYETFAGTVFFLLTPKAVLSKYAALFSAPTAPTAGIANEYIKGKLDLIADGVKSLYFGAKSAVMSKNNDENIASVFDKAAEISCRKCRNMHYCWQENYEGTLTVLNDLTEKMVRDGFINSSDFPLYFKEKCLNPELFVSALNSELRSLIYRREFKARYSENITAAYRNFGDMYLIIKSAAAEIDCESADYKAQRKLRRYLSAVGCTAAGYAFRDKFGRLHIELSGEGTYQFIKDENWLESLSDAMSLRLCTTDIIENGRLIVLEAEPYCINVGLAGSSSNPGEKSGDMGKFFKTDSGIMYIILSDGLGTGLGAEKMSRNTTEVLEKFLKAGLPPETALRILSDALLLKNETEVYSAAIDLMCIDLFTGKGKIFKSGSAPSFIKNDGEVTKIKTKSFSPGLSTGSDFSPSSVDLNFSDGTCAFILSDGIVSDPESEVWVSDLISGIDGAAPDMAKTVLTEAEKRYGRTDDQTAICISFSVRE